MPKIPISFDYGLYDDAERSVSNRDVVNCYPETNVGSANKTLLRVKNGYELVGKNATPVGQPDAAIFVNSTPFVIADGILYSLNSALDTWTSRGSVGAVIGNRKMISNGQNIIIFNKNAPSAVYYYDIGTATLALMSTLANFSTLAAPGLRDVEYHDGYYAFITQKTVFHGSNSATTPGLTFNASSFGVLPGGSGSALASANGILYAITNNKTYTYATAPTTPFSFAVASSQSIPVSSATTANAYVVDDDVYVVGDEAATSRSIYRISGNSFQDVGNYIVNEAASTYAERNMLKMTAYTYNQHRFIQFMQAPTYSPTIGASRAVVLDITESQLQGKPIWHECAMYDGAGGYTYFPIIDNIKMVGTLSSSFLGAYFLGVYGDRADSGIFQYPGVTQSFGNPLPFGNTASEENGFTYTFQYLRNSSEAIKIKSISMRFTRFVTYVELFSTTDGITFTSLGSFDLTSETEQTAQWRRIGRYNRDVQFKVFWQTQLRTLGGPDNNYRGSMIEGFIEV